MTIHILKKEEIPLLRPLLEAFYMEQITYKKVLFDWAHISGSLDIAIDHNQYLVLTDEEYKCCLMGHLGSNCMLPVVEGYDDFIYVHPDARGSSRFYRLLSVFEKWCKDNDVRYINLAVGTGIMDDKIKQMYTKRGYIHWLTGFKKECNKCVQVHV